MINKKILIILACVAYATSAVYNNGFYYIDEHYQLIEFAESQKAPTLNITPSSTLPWNPSSTDNSATKLGETSYQNSDHTANVKLSSNMLNKSSRLLIYSAIIHEALHAYIQYAVTATAEQVDPGAFSYNGNTYTEMSTWINKYGLPIGFNDHKSMMTYFFESTVILLEELDGIQLSSNPSVRQSQERKYVMAALYGLKEEGATAAQKAELATMYNGILTNHGLTSDQADNLYRTHIDVPNAENDNSSLNSPRLPTDAGCPF